MNHGEELDAYDEYEYYEEELSHKIDNKLKRFEQRFTCQMNKNMSEHVKTTEHCFDGRTVAILYKWISNDIISSIHGCIKTGKEGNVYYGKLGLNCTEQMKNGNIVGLPCSTIESKECSVGSIGALKIYKTSCMTFKDRAKYMDGERRFTSFCKSNSGKLAKVWAEKEIRNLNRLFNSNILCPRPIGIKLHVVLMEFIGIVRDGDAVDAAPRLVDVKGTTEFFSQLYIETLLILYNIYHSAQLVHADFSEYNILYHDDKLWVIDVAQAVEQQQVHALEFLKSDISNVERFFTLKGVETLSKSFILDWILLKLSINDINQERLAICHKVIEKTKMNLKIETLHLLCSEPLEPLPTNDVTFNSHIPNTLWEFDGTNKVEQAFMQDLISKPIEDKVITVVKERDYDKPSRGHRHEDRDDKKARKKAVKEQQKQNRIKKKQK